jgi:hypothetical protein
VGLGRGPFESSVPATPELTFSNKVVNFGVAVPGEIGAAGAWWEVAKKLAEIQGSPFPISTGGKSHKIDMSDWGIKLNVYEVSHCDPTAGYCVPGYAQNGIEPELYFDVILTYNGEAYEDWDFTRAVQRHRLDRDPVEPAQSHPPRPVTGPCTATRLG